MMTIASPSPPYFRHPKEDAVPIRGKKSFNPEAECFLREGVDAGPNVALQVVAEGT